MSELTRRHFFRTAGLAAVLPAIGATKLAAQEPAIPEIPNVRTETDIAFGRGGDMDLRLDVYHPPAGTGKRMAVIHVHGGGFAGGNKSDMVRIAPFYAEQGYVAIASQYRLSGEARWPAQLHDVKAAIRWTRANADRLNILPDRIAVTGHSAGGLMALFAGARREGRDLEGTGGNNDVSSRISVSVGYYAATSTPGNLLPEGATDAMREAADLNNYIDADFAPTILFHGLKDTTIRPENSQRFFQTLQDAGVPVELHFYQGVPHVFESNPEFALSSAQLASLFFDRHVLNPRTYPPFSPGGRGGRGGRGGGRGRGGV